MKDPQGYSTYYHIPNPLGCWPQFDTQTSDLNLILSAMNDVVVCEQVQPLSLMSILEFLDEFNRVGNLPEVFNVNTATHVTTL